MLQGIVRNQIEHDKLEEEWQEFVPRFRLVERMEPYIIFGEIIIVERAAVIETKILTLSDLNILSEQLKATPQKKFFEVVLQLSITDTQVVTEENVKEYFEGFVPKYTEVDIGVKSVTQMENE